MVIPNGIESNNLSDNSLSKRKIDVVYVGRLVSHKKKENNDKGVRYLVKALNQMKELKSLIIGEGPDKDYLIDLSKNRGTFFLGRKDPEEVLEYISLSKNISSPFSSRRGNTQCSHRGNECRNSSHSNGFWRY